MTARPYKRLARSVIVGRLAYSGWQHFGPDVLGWDGGINWPAALSLGVMGLCAVTAIRDAFDWLADGAEHLIAAAPTGSKGTARFVRSLREIRADLLSGQSGPYWGALKNEAIFADFEACAYTIGPSGSGKTTRVVQPMALALKGRSKAILDFKSELTPMLADALRARGEQVRIINLGDLFEERVGASDTYNPLTLIAGLYGEDGGLRDLTETLHQLCLQLYPEPTGGAGGQDDNRYFRDGSRRIIGFVIQTCVLIDGENATLGDVLHMLSDRDALLHHAQWAAGRLEIAPEEGGEPTRALMPLEQSPWVNQHSDPEDVEHYIAYYRALASGIADLLDTPDSKAAESFLSGALDRMSCFNITTRAHRKTSTSSFRFAALKEGDAPTSVFIMLDPNKVQAQAPVLGILLWAMLFELKRHPDKHRPVTILVDEASNVPWSDLGSTLTWARAFGLRFHFIFQNFAAFRAAHGEATLHILQSEAEIVQILPGIREPETLKALEALLGTRSFVARSRTSQKRGGIGIDSTAFSEDGRPLMSADEIRRLRKGILLIRQNRPLLIDLPQVAAISPWRRQVGINPYHGTPYVLPVKLRIGARRGGGWWRRVMSFLSRGGVL